MKKIDTHYSAQICESGHVISASGTTDDEFCSWCGASLICECPQCGSPIKGRLIDPFVHGRPYRRPAYCPYCGTPYPWTVKAQEALQELLELETLAEPEAKDLLDKSIPDLISETPKTKVAATRWRRFLDKLAPAAKETFRQVLIEIMAESAKRTMFGS